MRRIAVLLLAAVALVSGAPAALAHAFLDHAQPPVGSTSHGSPPELRLWFTQELEPAFSTVTLTDAGGKKVDHGGSAVDSADPKLLKLPLPPLPPGTYKVSWRVTSVDTHTTNGSFTITIAP